MAEPRDELKGRLLVLWLEDLKNDRPPQRYPEMELLSASDLEEAMDLARFIKGSFYPSGSMPTDMERFTNNLSDRLLAEMRKEAETTGIAIKNAGSFAELLRQTIALLDSDRIVLRELLKVPSLTLSQLESGELPPHRLPIEKMIRLLCALRLTSTGVIGVIRKSSLDWAEASSQRESARLGRVGDDFVGEERAELLQESGETGSTEVARVEAFCSALSGALRKLQ